MMINMNELSPSVNGTSRAKSLEESNDKAHKALSDKDDELKKLIEDNQAAIKGWPVER